jgi:hypothetical protein
LARRKIERVPRPPDVRANRPRSWVILGSALCLLGSCGHSKSPSSTAGDADGVADAAADGERRNAGDGLTDMPDAQATADTSPDADTGAGDAADAVADAVDVPDAIGARDDAVDVPDAIGASDDAADAGNSIGDATDGPDALRPLRPVHVVNASDGGLRGDDIRFVGSGLNAFEGRAVLVRVDYPDAVHVHGWGEARIVGGAFDLLLPGAALAQTFNPKAVLIDVNDDGQCESGEPGFTTFNPISGPTTVLVTPAVLMPAVGCTYVNSFPRF